MKSVIAGIAFLSAAVSVTPASAQTPCQPGTYAAPDGDFVVLAISPAVAAPALRYQFRDGRRGATSDADLPLTCGAADVSVEGEMWKPIVFRETPASFDSVGTKMNGMLIEPPGQNTKRPLVVMVHGSERSSPIGGIYGYAMAAQGIRSSSTTSAAPGDPRANILRISSCSPPMPRRRSTPRAG